MLNRFFFSAVLLSVLTGCTISENTAGAVVQRDSFYVVFDKKFKPEDAQKASLSGDVAGKKYPFVMPAKKSFYLENLCGTYTPIKDAAIVSFSIQAPADGIYYLGVGADYWYSCYLDGKLVGTTEPKGEPAGIPSYLNSRYKVRLKKGENRFFVHTRPGSGSWQFSCGLLPDLSAWPETYKERQLLFNSQFPQNSMTGPFVTHVSGDQAQICFELSRNIAAELRFKVSGQTGEIRTLSPRPVHGIIPRKKIHRFEVKRLLPGKKYEFEIFDMENFSGKIASGSFTTLPSEAAGHTLTAISDTQIANLLRVELIRSLVRKGVFKDTDLLVSLGDVATTFIDFSAAYFDSFLIPFREEGVHAPFYPVRGNHEYRGSDTDKFTQYFGTPYYAFRYGDVLYIVIDTGEDKPRILQNGHYTLLTDTKTYFQQQKRWLESLVRSNLCKTAKKRIVLAHATPFEWESKYYAGNIASFAGVFFGKNPECPIDLWLCGDIHSPYRFDPVTKELAGAARKLSKGRSGRLTANDLKNIHFPVYVNDGPRGAGKDFSVTRLEVKPDHMKITCTGNDGTVMDEIIIRKNQPFKINRSIYQKYIPYSR